MPNGVRSVGGGIHPAASTALSEALAANRRCLDQASGLCGLRSAL
jgi:hypothetical protein